MRWLILLSALAVLLAPPAVAAGDLRVALLYDASTQPPRLQADLAPGGAAWSSPVRWPLPSGTLLRVEDETGAPLASGIEPGGVLRVDPGDAARIRVVLEVDPLVARGHGFREGAFTAEGDDYAIAPPPGAAVVDRSPLPEARIIFGEASAQPPRPPVEPGADLVRVLEVEGANASVTLWWNASQRSLAPGDDATPDGWREAGREDLWGALAPGAQPWLATARASRLRIALEPEVGPGAYPLAGIGVEARAGERAFAGGKETRATHVAVPTGVDGWSRAEGGPFVVHARDPEDAAFVARAGERAGPALRTALEGAGLPRRDQIPVVVSPRGESGWARWGFVQPEAFVRGLRSTGQSWDEAAILVHEGFHGGQFDAAPWLDLAWWAEGSAGETDRHLPDEAYCGRGAAGDCFEPPTLDGADLARFGRERFPFEWRQPDPSLSSEETDYRYAASRHIVASYRDRAGEEAWRGAWREIADDPACCDHARLVAILARAAPGLTVDDIERARPPPAGAATPATPAATADAPAPPVVALLAGLALAAACRRRR